MAINLSATEAVDLVCNVFDCKREREGIQELYSYRGGTTVEDRELDLLAKTCAMNIVQNYDNRRITSPYTHLGY